MDSWMYLKLIFVKDINISAIYITFPDEYRSYDIGACEYYIKKKLNTRKLEHSWYTR